MGQYQETRKPRPKGICQSRLSIGDDFGDNSCTMRCQLKENHVAEELHREEYDSHSNGKVIVQWVKHGEERE